MSMDYPNNTNYTYTNNNNNNTTTTTSSSSSPNSTSATSSPLPRHTPKLSTPPPPPLREDCWSPDATFTLIEAWGQRYLHLNRGNLRQNHWRHVASVVNSLHPHPPRTHIQCKNRIDTVKKKYKIEKKSRVSNSNYVSSCPFFYLLDSFIGHSFKSSSSPTRRNKLPALPLSVPVAPRSKRRVTGRVPVWINESVEEEDYLGHGFPDMRVNEGYVIISEAIRRCGEIYKRVEEEKMRQMIELEKQRMIFAQELEIQRMKLLAESHIQLQRMRCPRRFIKQQRR